MRRAVPSARTLAVVLVAALVATALFVAGCTSAPKSTLESQVPGQAAPPPPPMLRDPKTSIYSYLVWISYAYRVLDSDVASMTFSPYEEVRVNSYVEYNRQEGRAIEPTLTSIAFKSERTKGSTATVAAYEEWLYRYISIQTGKYSTPPLKASYNTTYTVVYYPDKKQWLVDSVEASATTPIK